MSLMESGTVKIVKNNCSLCVHHACIFTTLNPTHAVVLEVVEQDHTLPVLRICILMVFVSVHIPILLD